MRAHYGHLAWWPGDSPFEVCVGAILVQNTSWRNVEQAIANLRAARLLEPRALHACPQSSLSRLLRPAGYYNIKAKRVAAFVRTVVEEHAGSLERLFAGSTARVRSRLLAVPGIGPETADSMLLYAGGHLSFVVDAYTRRIFLRHGWCAAADDYDALQGLCATAFGEGPEADRLDYWQDCHAQLVMVGKDWCRKRVPRCDGCPLRSLLPGGQPRDLPAE